MRTLLYVLFAIYSCTDAQDPDGGELDASTIVNKVLSGYEELISPNEVTKQPTITNVGVFIQQIHSFDDNNMQFEVTLQLRRIWTDPRLDYRQFSNVSEIVLRSDFVAKLWVPDIYFVNERAASFHDITQPNEAIWLSSDGTVFYSSRFSLILACPMKLQSFPLDRQDCNIEMKTFANNQENVQLVWRQVKPLEVPPRLFLQSFDFKDYQLQTCSDITRLEQTPCLSATFNLERKYGYHIITTYVPSAFVVSVSWVSFYVSQDSIPGRATLGTTTVLTIITQQFIGSLSLPQVPYVKAVDVWMTTCIIYVFLAFIEFIIVRVIVNKERRERLENQAQQMIARRQQGEFSSQAGILYLVASYLADMQRSHISQNAYKVDFLARILFPMTFVIFIVGYFIYYLVIIY